MNQVFHWLGMDNASGRVYLFWSGFFGDVTIFASAIAIARHRNCHIKGCWRLGKQVDGTAFLACHVHHPDHPGTKRNITLGQLHEVVEG